MGTQETGHNVQFVERITTRDKGVRINFLKTGRNYEFREEPDALEPRGTLSDEPHNAHEPVSRWTNEAAQTQDMESLLLPQNKEMTRAGTNDHSRESRFSALEMVVLQFLSTSQQCGAIVKV